MSSVESGAAAPSRPQTAGEWLRAARQQRGLHIAALAAALKVPQAKLEALEADRHADLPDATFARALAKAVCRTLKVDSAPVMALLPRGDEHELHVSLGINAPYRERGSSGDGGSLAVLQRPIFWGPALMLLAAAGLYLMPAHWLERAIETTPSVAASAPMVELAASAPEVTPSEAVVSAPPPVVAQAASVAASVPSPAASAATPVLAQPKPVAVAAATTAKAPNGQIPLTLKTTAASWVEVVDGSGQTLVSKIIPAGEENEFAGPPPLKVKIGNVAGTQLLLRGKPVDLLSQSKDNVARLELN